MAISRRQVLTSVGAVLAAPGVARAALPRVAIVGGGMAGVATAWLLDGLAEVTLFEAAPQLGGNVRSVSHAQDGHAWTVDLGAQYFHPEAYPAYAALLAALGFGDADQYAFDASITVDAPGEARPRFVSPLFPGRIWPLLTPWNLRALLAFQRLYAAAGRREANDAPYALSMAGWMDRLRLDPTLAQGLLLPWTASLYSGRTADAAALSARAAMTYVARALPPKPTDPVRYRVLRDGMIAPLHRMAQQSGGTDFRLGTPAVALQRLAGGAWRITGHDGGTVDADQVLLAASGEPTTALLAPITEAAGLVAALARLPFHDAQLTLHADAAYASATPAWRSFLNVRVEGDFAEASMDLARALPPGPGGQVATLWKSWTTHRSAAPAQVLHQTAFRHFLPTPDAIAAQGQLAALQGQGGLWVIGGYTMPFDAQETALLSAMSACAGAVPAVRTRGRWQAVARSRR